MSLRIPCPTCARLGRIPRAYPSGTVLMYCGPNGERVPYDICQTCGGSGWVIEQNNLVRPGS